MKKYRLKSFCKINLSLRVLKKLKNGYHKIQTFITFGDLCDIICISENRGMKDKIIFYGKFKDYINNESNTITKVLKLFRKKKLLNKKVFKIKINKNIPHGAGLGGGSSNAASLINFFNSQFNLNFNKDQIYKLGNAVGSDVPISLIQKNLFVNGKENRTLKLKKKYKFNVLIIFPNLLLSTKKIYLKNRTFSLPRSLSYETLNNKRALVHFLQNEHNDLQETVIKMHPNIGKIIKVIASQNGCYFSRLTGSGSACIGLFSSIKNATLAKKIIRKKFPEYWYVISKTI